MRELLAKWRGLEIVELEQELAELIKQQFKLKMQHGIGELKQGHLLKNVRRKAVASRQR